mgnify:CR=1 FL=1
MSYRIFARIAFASALGMGIILAPDALRGNVDEHVYIGWWFLGHIFMLVRFAEDGWGRE